ncbi:MAG: tRNA (adenosine(37)-N6)-threonylcarbamoyltransferase complex ATPase subunit type 1 TsaE [Myxococcota bacterium]
MQVVRKTSSEAQTVALARKLAGVMTPGTHVLLTGDLGAGKTAFVRGLVSGLQGGKDVRVKSPTYALCHAYPTTPRIWHADLYRLQGQAHVEVLGILDSVEPSDLLVVEWAEIAPDISADAIRARLRITGPKTREITFTSTGARSESVLRQFTRAES